MPLPPALAARLAKRGILSKATQESNSKEDEEEVFAENYDDQNVSSSSELSKRRKKKNLHHHSNVHDKTRFMGYPGCPNKWNVYHECLPWCLNTFGSGKFKTADKADPDYLRRHKAMTGKYCDPLPDDWKEHFDPGTGRHFYWCTRTDKVSWLPPGHPKFKLMEAASKLREILKMHAEEEGDEDEDEDDDEGQEQEMDLDSDMSDEDEDEDRSGSNSGSSSSSSESDEDDEERRRRRRKKRHRDRGDHHHRRDRRDHHRGDRDRSRHDRRGRRDHNRGGREDPMDPSSYSDAPKGTWSSGINSDRD